MMFATETVPGAAYSGIGGPDHTSPFGVRTGYGIEAGTYAYVVVNMPKTSTDGVYDGHVYIRAAQLGANRPIITGFPTTASQTSRFPLNDLLPRPVREGGLFRTSIGIDSDDVGSGPLISTRWEIIPGRGNLPPDLEIKGSPGAIVNIEGPALKADSYNFSVGITLPGTMRLERDYNIVIVPWDGLGDVDGNGVVDLRDLVLLVRFQRNASLNINIRNASLSTNGEADCECCPGDHRPGQADIELLTTYFTHSQGRFER
jgi:hypothetical protein